MKKNLLSILILALLIVNVVLTALMMFSVTGTNRKTAALIDDIASIIELDLTAGQPEEIAKEVSIADTVPFPLESMTVGLRKTDDATHYFISVVTLSLDKKDSGYKSYYEGMEENITLIRSAIQEVIGQYTLEEIQDDEAGVRRAIVERLQTMYDSEFIYDVLFSETIYQ